MIDLPVRQRRVLGRGVPLPPWWDETTHDLRVVRLNDGRRVALTGMEVSRARAQTPEDLLRLAQEIAYDEERSG